MDLPRCTSARPLSGRDWETLRSLRLGALADSPEAFLGRPGEAAWQPEEWRRSADRGAWFGAFIDETPTGLASVVYDVPTGDHYVESMWVMPRFRRRGVAVALFTVVERYVANQSGSVLRLWVLDGNPSAAAAYVRYGFRSTERRQQAPGYAGVNEEEFVIGVPSRRAGGAQSTIQGMTTPDPVAGTGSFTERRISIRSR